MNIKVEDLSPIKKKLSIEVAADIVATELDSAFQKIAKTANIKGFRKGKVPRAILEQHYGPKAQYDAIGPLINNTLYKAIVDNGIEAVSQPEVVKSGLVEKGKPFSYEAEVEIRPNIEAKDYTGLQLEKEKFVFAENRVDEQLEQMATSRVQLEVTSRKKAREGDTVIIDFKGFIDETPFENGSADDYQLELGSNSFIPGFEDQLIGMKREQEKDIEVTFPEGYGAKDLAGKPAVFKVLVKEIKEKIVPTIDDDFAKEFDAENLAELKERIKEGLVAQEQQRIEGQLNEDLMTALIDANSFAVPEGMVQNQLMYMKDNFAQRLKSQGMSLEMLGMNDQTFASSYRDTAERQVKGELLLDAIAGQEDISVADEDVEQKVQSFAEESKTPLEQVQKFFEDEQAKAGLKGQILQDKVIKFLIDKAKVKEVDPPKPESAEENSQKES